MAEEQKPETKPARQRADMKTALLFVFPTILAAIGAYIALTRPAPNEAQKAAAHAAPLVESSQPRP